MGFESMPGGNEGEQNIKTKEDENYLLRKTEDEGYINWLEGEVKNLFEEMKQAEQSGNTDALEKRTRWERASRALSESKTAFSRGDEVKRESGF